MLCRYFPLAYSELCNTTEVDSCVCFLKQCLNINPSSFHPNRFAETTSLLLGHISPARAGGCLNPTATQRAIGSCPLHAAYSIINELELSGQDSLIQNSSTWTHIGSRLVQEDQVKKIEFFRKYVLISTYGDNTSCSGRYLIFIFLVIVTLQLLDKILTNTAQPKYHKYNTSLRCLVFPQILSFFNFHCRWSMPERHTSEPSP